MHVHAAKEESVPLLAVIGKSIFSSESVICDLAKAYECLKPEWAHQQRPKGLNSKVSNQFPSTRTQGTFLFLSCTGFLHMPSIICMQQ